MTPSQRHANVMGGIHGGALLGFLDIALFGGGVALEAYEPQASVTVEVNTHFMASGSLDRPVVAEVEVMKTTRRMAFVRGVMRQEGEALFQYSAIIRRGIAVS